MAIDLIEMIALVTVGALALQGRIKLPTQIGKALLGGAGGIILLPI